MYTPSRNDLFWLYKTPAMSPVFHELLYSSLNIICIIITPLKTFSAGQLLTIYNFFFYYTCVCGEISKNIYDGSRNVGVAGIFCTRADAGQNVPKLVDCVGLRKLMQ